MSRIALIVAMSENGVIGNKGRLPWRIPEDMRWFKERTIGKPCIMGRKTWDSLPKKPLVDRPNIVVTRSDAFQAEGATVAHSFAEAVAIANTLMPDAEEIMVLGGAELFAVALPQADRVYLTRVHAEIEGDVRMPLFDPDQWKEVTRSYTREPAQYRASFVVLDRR